MTSITPSPEMVERAMKPISMGDVRLAAGEGQLSAHDVLAAVNGILASRRRSLTAALSCPDGFRLVPVEPTSAMLDRAVAFALNVTLSGEYNWSAYMRDVWRAMLAASPAPSQDAPPPRSLSNKD